MSTQKRPAANGRATRIVPPGALKESTSGDVSPATAVKMSYWTGAAGRFEASVQQFVGLVVITLRGQVAENSMQACRSALHSALRARTTHVVVELSRAGVDERSIPVLRLMDRAAARCGVTLWWAGLTTPSREILSRTDLLTPRRCFASVSEARSAVEPSAEHPKH